ncbi:MAG TPA: hypothetical protein VKE40_14950 [Gemmataceae bacterium]|nr:hypothetical protein [Gemmataceae bacterium]
MNDYGDGNRGRPEYDDYDDRRARDAGGERSEESDQLRKAALAKVRAPGLMMQLFGALSVAFGTMCGGVSFVSPKAVIDWAYDKAEEAEKQNPQNPKQQRPPREEATKSLQVQGALYGIVSLVSGIVIFIGGSKMKDLKGYGWAITGSVLSIFPGLCCVCIGLIPGIWGLVVLLNPDVKYAYSRFASG